jgi:2-amino-4-hydroxy-6-hydroxymethyldihydropteridine diphosphokinase
LSNSFIGLGSNLGEPLKQLQQAARTLAELPHSQLLATSSVYRSAAVGPGPQPDYLNAVARLRTSLAPLELLHALQDIEQQQGRTRERRWGARTLDLDLLLYGQCVLDSSELTLPHPALQDRHFVLYPLAELCPDLVLPCGTDLDTLLASCPPTGLVNTGQRLDSAAVRSER